MCIIIFSVDKIYQDIGFKIISMEWELSNKKGFRTEFKEGVLKLKFFFKKLKWKR